ncbi:DUF4381 domain-containing protein [Xanthobacter sp. KR7-65]|uniref:DUF4381 domain-containing protein n=1 Tax=Xanthobacter sp. KR7-65 TaxID=3156612 RepID=UPI0032B4D3B5
MIAPAMAAPDFSTPTVPGSPGTEDPLAALRDIHLPPEVPVWPPAPGWYALAGLVVLVLIVLAIREWRWRQTLAYKALKAFDAALGPPGAADAQQVAVAASDVLRRLVRAQGGDRQAALTGAAWSGLLASGRRGLAPAEAAFLAEAPYVPPGSAAGGVSADALAAAVRRFIRARA